jgi:polar amino acid transport system substrate-binding protein
MPDGIKEETMDTPMRRVGGLAAVALLVVAACTSGATPSPTSVPTVSPEASVPATTEASPSAVASPTAGATVPDGQLIFADKLVICSDIPYPPQEFFDAQGNPTGSDIEIGQEIAKRLGLTAQIENAVFDTIIAAVTGGKCDIVISAQNITPDRVKQVDMIPYFQAGQSFVVAKGNPKGINATTDLCGKAVAAETGTTEVNYLNGTGAYKGKGLSAACVAAGKGKIDVKEFTKDTEALAALLGAQVDAYFADSPTAANYTIQHADQFDLSGIPPLDPAPEGISVPKDKTGLRDAVKAALLSMIDDGTYLTILKKYKVETGAVEASAIK